MDKLIDRLKNIDRVSTADLKTLQEAIEILDNVEQWLEAKVALGDWNKPPSEFGRAILRQLKGLQ